MNDHLDDRLRELSRDYNEPAPPLSAPRREAMWERIEAARAASPAGSNARAPRRASSHRITRVLWPMAAAALLLLGIGIGRNLDPGTVPTTPEPAQEAPRWSQTSAEAMYRVAARDYLRRTDTLLTEFRQAALTPNQDGSAGNGTPLIFGLAGDLLVHTRLLMDSPAADSPELERLLRDLEYILAQIVQLTDESDPRERAAIRESIEKRSVLWRVRDVLPADGATRGA